MKKIIVYCLESNGVTARHTSMDGLLDHLKTEVHDNQEELLYIEFEIFFEEMTEQEIEDLPEFEEF